MTKPKKAKDSPEEKEKQQVDKWLTKISRAETVKKAWKERFRIPTAYEYFEGAMRPASVPDEEWITINKIYATLKTELPTLYSQNPEFHVKIKRSRSTVLEETQMLEAQAKVRSAVLNYLRDELKLKRSCRLSIFDSYFQYGVAKVGYEVEMIANPKANDPIKDAMGNPLWVEDELQLEPEELPTNQRYVVQRLHPDDHLVDEDANPLSFSWAAHRIRRRLDDVKKDERYKESARLKVKATEISQEEKDRERRKKGDEGKVTVKTDKETPDIVVIWEIWDTENLEMCVVSEGCREEFLIEPESYPPGIENDPFIDLRFFLRDDSWYPLPPISQLIDPQKEYCLTRSKILTHRKRFNRKYEAYTPAFDDPEMVMAKLTSGEDGTVIEKNQPQQAIMPIQDSPLDMQVHTELAYYDRDFQELATGTNQRGYGAGVDSATEAGIVEKRQVIQESDKQSEVSEFISEIGRKLDQLVQANLTEEFAVKVAGIQGESWMMVRPADYDNIYGEFDTTVVVGSHTPQLPEIERAQIINWLSLIMANISVVGLMPQTMRLVGKKFQIEDRVLDLIIGELAAASQAVMSGMAPQGQQQGSLPGTPESREQSAGPGAALGHLNIRGGMQ